MFSVWIHSFCLSVWLLHIVSEHVGHCFWFWNLHVFAWLLSLLTDHLLSVNKLSSVICLSIGLMMTLFVVCSLAVRGVGAVEMNLHLTPSYTGARSAAAADKTSSSVYLSIISQQTYLGCWTLNTELSKLLNVGLDELQKSAPVKVRGNLYYEQLWTVQEIKLLHDFYSSAQRDVLQWCIPVFIVWILWHKYWWLQSLIAS